MATKTQEIAHTELDPAVLQTALAATGYEELAPCPFCGRPPKVIRTKEPTGWYMIFCGPVHHPLINCETSYCTRLEEAVREWNNRPLESALRWKLREQTGLTEEQVIERLAERGKGLTQKALAGKLGMAESYLCGILNHHRRPSWDVLKFLKLKRVVLYVPED